MKNIKVLLLAAAVLLSFSSCTKRNFTVETGNTPVEFAATTITLNAEYIYIPVHQLAASDVYTPVTLEIVSCSALHLDGSTITLENDSDVILTSSELNVAPLGEEGDGESSFEIRVPAYTDYQNVLIDVKLTGPDTNIETTITLQGVTRYNMVGTWNWNTMGTVQIIENEEGDYSDFYIDLGVGFWIPAERKVNNLEIDNTFLFEWGSYLAHFVFFDGAAGTYNTNAPVVLSFTDDNNFTATGWLLHATDEAGSDLGYFQYAGEGVGVRVVE